MTQTTTDSFWNEYSRLVARLMPPLSLGDGVPEAEIVAAEARMGVKLPSLLREFYLRAGRREDINAAHNRLVALAELEVDQGRLVFYEENQSVVLWGVSIQNPEDTDPAVFMAENQQELTWEFDHDHVSEFLRAMLLFQAVNGGMAYHGIGSTTSEDLATLSDGWEVVDLGGDSIDIIGFNESKAGALHRRSSADDGKKRAGCAGHRRSPSPDPRCPPASTAEPL